MIINFDEIKESVMPNFYQGEGALATHMYVDDKAKIMQGKLVPGASIGLHTHETSSEMIFVLAGVGTVLYDGETENVYAGQCHYCPKGHSHSLMNKGETDLIFFAVVPQQ